MSTDKAKLYAKIKAVYEDVDYIQKDKRNSFHGYSYASEAAIKDHLHQAFMKHGLVMLPPDVESVEDTKKTNEKGKEEIITTARIKFGIADVETGSELHGTLYGRGVDASDKGIYKAITGGLKYFLTTTFLIPTGDDPEEEPEKPKEKGSREAQKAVADRKVAEAEAKITELKAAMPTPAPVNQSLGRAVMPDTQKESKPKSDYQKMMDAIQALKAEFEELKATDRYYFILGQHGFEKSNQIKKIDEGRNVYRDLLAELKVVRASTPIEGQDESQVVVA